jgi:hypothetical protein
VTDREAPPEVGFDHAQADPYDNDGWFGGEQAAAPTFVDDVPTPPHGEPVTHVPEERFVTPREAAPAPAPLTRPVPTATVNTWTVNGQLRASDTSTLTFRAPPAPWYRTKQARIALMAVAAAAVLVPIVVLAWPEGSSTAPEPSTSVAPQPSTTQPARSSAPPAPINLPPPLPPPPPPPPPPEDTGSAPTYNEPDWTRPAPEPTQKAPTPVTRAPISVAPVPRRPTERNSLGESDKPGCAGWC